MDTSIHTPLKVLLHGYGKMGQLLEERLNARGHTIVARIDAHAERADSTVWDAALCEDADVCIDFSATDAAGSALRNAVAHGIPIVTGTTGWHDHLDEWHALVNEYSGTWVYGANFSIGMQIFQHIVGIAAQRGMRFDYDIAGYELHHRAKKDAPSGTAHLLRRVIAEAADGYETEFASTRCGSIPGTHTVLLDSPHDTIELVHRARNRVGFADGAVWAAEQVRSIQGVWSFEALVRNYITQEDRV